MKKEELLNLLYLSRATVSFSQKDLEKLMKTSRERNAENKIRGILLFNSGHFLQFLEGPIEAVSETLRRIRLDKRHANIELLFQAPGDRYLFPEWHMGLINLEKSKKLNTTQIKKTFDELRNLESLKGRPSAEVHMVVVEALKLFKTNLVSSSKTAGPKAVKAPRR